MPRVELKKEAVQKANEEFYLLHPDRKNRPLAQGPDDSTLTWMQKVVVWTRRFPKSAQIQSLAPGSKMVRIPTAYPDSIQKAVNQYIADKTHYHVVTNNCADFVNDTINAASDINVSDRTKPLDYYKQLQTISKKPFGPRSLLEAKFKSSKYLSMPLEDSEPLIGAV
jgi:hypothetical protein